MHSHYNRNKAKALSERGKRMAAARWERERQQSYAEEPERLRHLAEIDAENLPRRQGDPLGCLQWTDFRTGKVIRWVATIGDRADRVTLRAPSGRLSKSHGWTWILSKVRRVILNHC
jgi:hypothetical protein